MAVTLAEYDQHTVDVGGVTTWGLAGASATPGNWFVVVHGIAAGDIADMGGDPSRDTTGWPAGSWSLLAEIDVGRGLPKWRMWAAKIPNPAPSQIKLQTPDGIDCHQHLFVLSGCRDGGADAVFSVGAASSADNESAQTVPFYSSDSAGEAFLAVWLNGTLADYSVDAGLLAQAELDGAASTSRAGTGAIGGYGTGTVTSTASASAPWVAVTMLARPDTGAAVTFPDAPLQVRTELALGANPDADPATWAGLWTDITSDVYARQPITITRGRGDEASTVQPSTMALELNNAAGKYTRLNPLSPYYGLLSKNTPIRLWVDPGSGWDLRYTGFVSEWPPRQQGGDVDQAMPIQASGIMRRLNQGSVLNSAMARWVPTRPFVGYWPLETDTSSGLLGGHAMTVAGTVTFGSGGPPGSAGAMSTADNGKTYAPVTGMADNGGWIVAWWVEVPDGFDSATQQGVLVDWQTPGMRYSRWLAYAAPGGGGAMVVGGYDDNDNVITAAGSTNLAGLGPTLISVRCAQSGANIEVTVYLGSTIADASVSAADTAKPITSISVNGYLGSTDPIQGSISHLMVGDGDPDRLQDQFVSTNHAAIGYAGETAADRISRVAAEEGVSIAVAGNDGTSEQMGPQPVATFLSLLRDCEAADGGVLYEQRNGRLAYQCRSGRYNQTPSLVLDYASGHVAPPLEPTDDDQRTRNDWSVSRDGGGTVRVTDDAHAAVVGRYADSTSLNIAGDGRLADQAGWRVHLGTNDDLRYPAIAPNLNGKAADLIPGWLAAEIGQAAQLTSPAADLAAGTVDLIGEGYTETIDLVDWRASLNCSPGTPWRITVRDTDRRDTAGSQLAVSAGTSDATMWVDTTSGPYWTTSAGDLPFDVAVGGEQVTVSAITAAGVLNSDPHFNTLSAWSASGGTFTANGVGVLTPNGTSGTVQVLSTPHATVTAGNVYRARGLLQCANTRTVNFVVNWYTSGDVFISASTIAMALIMNVLVSEDTYLTAPAGAAKAAIGASMTGTPAAGDVLFLDEFYLTAVQKFTVARAVNGIVKAHAAGTAVRLYDQTYRAL